MMPSQQYLNNKQNDNWLAALLIYINPVNGPGIILAIFATVVEEANQGIPWYILLCICLTNLLVVRLISLILVTLQHYLNNEQGDNWLATLLAFIDPQRGPGILIAIMATIAEEVGQYLPWYILLCICLTNLLVIRLLSLIVIDIFCFFLDIFSYIGKANHQKILYQNSPLDQRGSKSNRNRQHSQHRTSQSAHRNVAYNRLSIM